MTQVPGFPGIGPTGQVGIVDASTAFTNAGVLVNPDQALTAGGFLLYSVLAELRVISQLLQSIANTSDDLKQMRTDAIADMGTLYVANPPTPVLSS